jgi:hypothetical protein
MMMIMEQLVEWGLAGETEVLGENLPQCRFVHHKSHWPDLGSNPSRRGGKPATNRLSYGTACFYGYIVSKSKNSVDSICSFILAAGHIYKFNKPYLTHSLRDTIMTTRNVYDFICGYWWLFNQ